jgi:hypothetical protein
LRHSRLDQLQLVVDVAAPVEVEIDLSRSARGFDLMRAIPGMPFIASSIGRVTVTSVCDAGASPLSTMMTMRGKSVCGNTAIGSCQAA